MRSCSSSDDLAILDPDRNQDVSADVQFNATRGYSGVGCLIATLSAGIPTTTNGRSSFACDCIGTEQNVAVIATATRPR
jgi:hypothetical protein